MAMSNALDSVINGPARVPTDLGWPDERGSQCSTE